MSGVWGPAAILLSAFLAGIYATFQVRNQRRIARQNMAFDFVFRSETGEYWIAKQTFRRRVRDCRLMALVNPEDESDLEARREVEKYLNWYEMLATAILRGAIGEPTAYTLTCGDVCTTWLDAKPFIEALREVTGRGDVYVEFEGLAARWSKKMRKTHPATKLVATGGNHSYAAAPQALRKAPPAPAIPLSARLRR